MIRFDTIAMLDWSGVPDRGPLPKRDAIWAALYRGRTEPPVYLRSLAVAETWITEIARTEIAAGRRLLVGFDFPFGYPEGAAARIAGREAPRELWAELAAGLAAAETRFHLAGELNGRFPGSGPYWFNGFRRDVPGLPRRKQASGTVAEWRQAERAARGTFSCWQMGGAGSVGSQAMTGMAMLHRLSRSLGQDLSVWPFDAPSQVHAVEIWPSLFREAVDARMVDQHMPRDRRGPIRDAVQVVAMADAVAAAQSDGRLEAWLNAPPPDARRSEGWILGAGA